MTRKVFMRTWRCSIVTIVVLLVVNGMAAAHCDRMDGPVVVAARKALETRDVNLVLIWVQQKDEAEIKQAFQATLRVRGLSPEAKELADRYFFETLVRLHRTEEGAPYTGLKPAGRDLGPAIPAADKALAEGSSEQLQQLLANALQAGLRGHFDKALAKKGFRSDDLAPGRQYVEAYVEYVHFVERTYEASTKPTQGHYREPGESREEAVHAEY
jgi:hypothetical protein